MEKKILCYEWKTKYYSNCTNNENNASLLYFKHGSQSIFKKLLLLAEWNSAQYYFNSPVSGYQLFQASVKILITGKNELHLLYQTCINMPI